MAEVVVVGAGVGGLAAAARLAAGGHSVTVCEQAPQVGGKLSRLQLGEFLFDTGPSLLTMPYVFAELFAATGSALERHLEVVPVDPVARYRFPDGTEMDASGDIGHFCLTVDRSLSAGSGKDWRRLMAHASRVWNVVRGPYLESSLSGAGDLARLALRTRDLAVVQPWRTLRQLGRWYLRDPRLRLYLDRYATYTGSDPRRAPAALVTVPFVEQHYGAWYVRGGLYRLAEALAERVVALGGDIQTRAAVVAVDVADGAVRGVRLADGQRLPAQIVVVNADAGHLYGDLLPAAVGATPLRRLRRVTPSLSGFVLLLGLRGRTPGLTHHRVLFGDDYDTEFDALFAADAQPVANPTIYVSAPDDPAVRPRDGESWFVLVNAPRQGQVDWRAPGLADGYAEHLLDVLAMRGLPIRDRIAERAVLTPADLAERTRAVGGAIYGTSSNGPRAAFLRPGNRGPAKGLFLVGGSAHPGGGLPLVAMSARIVSDLIGPA